MSTNARHRKHYKSGSSLDRHALGHISFAGRKFRILLDAAEDYFRRFIAPRRNAAGAKAA
jgi:hypothetical protein